MSAGWLRLIPGGRDLHCLLSSVWHSMFSISMLHLSMWPHLYSISDHVFILLPGFPGIALAFTFVRLSAWMRLRGLCCCCLINDGGICLCAVLC